MHVLHAKPEVSAINRQHLAMKTIARAHKHKAALCSKIPSIEDANVREDECEKLRELSYVIILGVCVVPLSR